MDALRYRGCQNKAVIYNWIFHMAFPEKWAITNEQRTANLVRCRLKRSCQVAFGMYCLFRASPPSQVFTARLAKYPQSPTRTSPRRPRACGERVLIL
jgi:hypothetical protein